MAAVKSACFTWRRLCRYLLAMAPILAAKGTLCRADIHWIAPTGSGSWGDISNWSGGNPEGAGVFVELNSPIPGTITLDGDRTIGTLSYQGTTLGSADFLTQGSGGSLIFDNGMSGGSIFVNSNPQLIDAPIILHSNVTIEGASGLLTLTGSISGASDLSISSSVVLAGNNSYANTAISHGNVTVGNGGTTGSLGTGSVTNNGKLTYNLATPTVLPFIMNGTGSLTQIGSASLTLTGQNTYTGTTTVGANSTLIVDYLTTSTNVIAPGSALAVNQQGALSFISSASGTSVQSFTNSLNMQPGSALNITDRDLGAFNIQFGNATFNGLTSVNLSGGLGGTVTLGAQTYDGSTTINASTGWTVNLGSSLLRTAGAGSVDFTGSALVLTGASNVYGAILGGWATVNSRTWATSDGTKLTGLASYVNDAWTGGDTNVTVSSSVSSGISDSLRFDLPNTVNVTLIGTNTISSGGILVTPDVGSNVATISGGVLVPGASQEIILNQLDPSGTLVLSATIRDTSLPTSLTKLGPGRAIVAGANGQSSLSYSGTTTIIAGTLLLGVPLALPSGPVTVAAGATLDLNGFNLILQSVQSNGTIDNSAASPATLTLSGNSGIRSIGNTGGPLSVFLIGGGSAFTGPSTYSGDTVIDNASLTIRLGSINAAPSQSHFVLAAGTLTITDGNIAFQEGLNGVGAVAGASTIVEEFTQAVNFGNISRTKGATLNFTDDLGLTNTVTSSSNGPSGILGGWATVSQGSVLNWASVSGGDLVALAASGYSSNTFSPGVNTDVISSFITNATSTASIRFATAAASVLTLSGPSSVDSGGILVGQAVSGNVAKITGGSLTSGNGTDLIVNVSDISPIFAGFVIESPIVDSGATSIGLTKSGSGSLVLAAANTFSGPVYLDAGSLVLNELNALPGDGTIYFNGGTLQNSSANALDYSSRFSQDPQQFYTINTNGQIVTLATPLTSIGGTFTKRGLGTLILTGVNLYDGTTTVSGGTLQVGAGAVSGALGSGPIVDNAVMALNRSDTFSLPNLISGSGTLTQIGAGTATITNTSTFAGKTIILNGTLQLGDGSANGSLGTSAIANNATLAIKPTNALVLPNAISGAGTLAHSGGGTTTLTGPYSATGSVALSAGELAFGSTNSTRQTPAVLLTMSGLTMSPATSLDVTNHDVMIGNSSLATIQALLLKGLGKSGGPSDPSIDSSSASALGDTFLVPVDADALLGTGQPGSAIGRTIDGSMISQPDTILLKYTYIGDVNLDGKIDSLDFATVNAHFLQTTPGLSDISAAWLMGDVNLDGVVNSEDLALLTANEAASQSSPLGALDLSPIPEPSSLAIMLISAPLLFHRRRRPNSTSLESRSRSACGIVA